MSRSRNKALGISAAVTLLAGAIIAHFEGTLPVGYSDPIGIPTACTGHTGPGVAVGQRYSPEQCRAWLDQDMGEANAQVRRCIHVAMPPNVEAAFTSAAFNIGPAIVCGSTLQRKANAGDLMGACAELSRWDYAGGKRLPGLTKRRAAERAVCEGKQWAL